MLHPPMCSMCGLSDPVHLSSCTWTPPPTLYPLGQWEPRLLGSLRKVRTPFPSTHLPTESAPSRVGSETPHCWCPLYSRCPPAHRLYVWSGAPRPLRSPPDCACEPPPRALMDALQFRPPRLWKTSLADLRASRRLAPSVTAVTTLSTVMRWSQALRLGRSSAGTPGSAGEASCWR